MSEDHNGRRVIVSGATLVDAAGPLPAGTEVVATFSPGTLDLFGGEPPAAWQIPLAAIRGVSLSSRRSTIEVAGWVAGSHVRLRFEHGALTTGTSDELASILSVTSPTSTKGRQGATRRWWWALAAAVSVLIAGAGVWLTVRGTDQANSQARASARAQARSVDLSGRQLPVDFEVDDPSTSPLAGLLGTEPASTPTAADRRDTRSIEVRYRSCLGVTNATDREFGRAGVVPLVDVPSLPFGRIGASGDIEEVGSVTQRYASVAEVDADKRQMSLPRFPACFAAALARFVAGTPSAPVASTAQHLTQPFGAWATGGTATVQVADLNGTMPVQIGVSVLLVGRDEQYLYTFASAGHFPASLRNHLVAEQGPRLAGVPRPKTA